nr:hypothetical protein [Parachlamydiaceae bacterium]
MISVKNVRTLNGDVTNYEIPSSDDRKIEAEGKLLLFPGIIDPDICFGSVDSQNWKAAIQSAIKAGITTTIELPSAILLHNTKSELEQKKIQVEEALLDLKIPLNHFEYLLYSGENLENINQLGSEKKMVKGLALQLDYEQDEILDEKWEHLFRLAAVDDLPVVINARNGDSKHRALKKKSKGFLEKAIEYVEKWSCRLYVLNVATQNEIDLIQKARNRSLLIYAETSPQYLFPEDTSNCKHLWEALNNNVIETIGSGYNVNQQVQEKVHFNGNDYN